MLAKAVESFHSHAEAAMGLGKDAQECTVLLVMDMDAKLWVNAELVKGLVAQHVLFVTCTQRLEVQDLSATTAPARLWKQ